MLRPAAGAAVESLPSADEVYSRAPGENFSVASIVLGRDNKRHLTAIYGYARLVDQIGDAVAGTASPPSMRSRPISRGYSAGRSRPPGLRRLEPTVHQLASRASRSTASSRRTAATRRSPIRGVRRARRLLRPLGDSGRRARPSCLRRGDARPIALSDKSAPLSSSPSTGRTSSRTAPPAGSTSRPRISIALASSPPTSTPGDDRRGAGADRVRGRPRPGAPRRGRTARRAARRPGADRRRGLRRRRPRGPRRDRLLPLRRPRRAPRADRRRRALSTLDLCTGAGADDSGRPRVRPLPPRRPGRRVELLLRHAAAAAGPPQRALRRLRARAADRRRRRRGRSRRGQARRARGDPGEGSHA